MAAEEYSVPLDEAALRCGVSASALYKRIQTGNLPGRQETRGRRRWMLRPSDVDALGAAQPVVGEWVGDFLAQLADRDRQLEALHAVLRELERRSASLEAQNSELRGKVRDLQSALAATWRGMSDALGESVNLLTMPDTPND